MATVTDWIITVHNSEGEQTVMFRKFGDKLDIAQTMWKMIKDTRKDHEDTWDEDIATKSVAEIMNYNDTDDILYGVAAFYDHHIDFTAKRLDYIEELE